MKRIFLAALAALLALSLFAACGGAPASSSAAPSAASSAASHSQSEAPSSETPVRVAGLKGPTTMGMVKLMEDAANGEAAHAYQVEMFGTADEIVPKLVSGDMDIAAIPANLASVLYNSTGGKIQVAAINTLGVLYVVETGNSISSIADLAGKTIYSTGKGTTPEFALNYILRQNGLNPQTDLTIEYKSEATEIAALLAEGTDAVAVLPQPYVTAVQMQNEQVRVALNLTEEWDRVSQSGGMVTGVLVARTEFVEQNPDLFANFLADYSSSIKWVQANTAEAAELVARYGIVEKAPVAAKALPACNIVYLDGAEMKEQLAGYLQVLYNQNPEAVGGALPDDAFYYGA